MGCLHLEKNPIIEIKKTAQDLGLAYNTISKAVGVLVDKEILCENDKSGRARTFSYKKYLEILRRDTE